MLSSPALSIFSREVSFSSVVSILFYAIGYFMALIHGCQHITDVRSFFISCGVCFVSRPRVEVMKVKMPIRMQN